MKGTGGAAAFSTLEMLPKALGTALWCSMTEPEDL